MIKQAMCIAFTLPIIDDSISVILGDFLWNSPPPSWLWWVGGLVGLDQIKIDTSSPTEVKNSDVTKSVNFTQAAQTVLKKEEDEET